MKQIFRKALGHTTQPCWSQLTKWSKIIAYGIDTKFMVHEKLRTKNRSNKHMLKEREEEYIT